MQGGPQSHTSYRNQTSNPSSTFELSRQLICVLPSASVVTVTSLGAFPSKDLDWIDKYGLLAAAREAVRPDLESG